MALPKSEYVSNVWRDGIFGTSSLSSPQLSLILYPDGKVVFCTGGAGTICSAQVRALVHLGANACIIGRNVEKTESMAKNIATTRQSAKVIGLGAIDVRKIGDLEKAAEICVKELGGIDYVMYVLSKSTCPSKYWLTS
jgi:peroxisomal 2,4-dienoyl-CoA reductase